jgi:predicted NBD/HSP70 family sugar kinase
MYVGVDIGGTKTFVGALDDNGVLQEQHRFPTPKSYEDFIGQMEKIVAEMSTKNFHAGCVAVPGKVDREHGIGLTLGNLPWKNVPIQADLEQTFACPILVENDANLAGLSEAMLLKGQYRKVLYVTVSTGIGTGIITDGVIDPDFADSEGGHIMLEHNGRMQTWESFASGHAIVQRYGKRAEDITDEDTWKRISHDLAVGLIDLVAVVQPEVIVMGGGVDSYFERFQPFLQAELQKYQTPLTPIPPIVKAARPEEAVIYGCYDLARMRYGKHHR